MRTIPSTRNLQCFVVVSEEKSFTKAADKLFLTQSAISKNIRHLEESLNIKLFNRRLNKISLTKKGKKYYTNIKQSLQEISNYTAEITEVSPKKKIIINITPSLSDFSINLLEKFQKQNTAYQVILRNNTDAKDCDIEIAAFNKKPKNSTKLFDEKMFLIGHKDIKMKDVKEVTDYNFLIHSSRPSTINQFFKRNKINPENIKNQISCEHFYMIVNAAKKKLGIGLVPDFLVTDEINNACLKNICNLSYQSGYSYYAITNNSAAKEFLEDFLQLMA